MGNFMTFITRSVAHCDQPTCGHEWLTTGMPTHCAKCKSRRWNDGSKAEPKDILQQAVDQAPEGVDSVSLHSEAGTLIETRAVDLPEVAIAKSSKSHNSKSCRVYKCGLCAAKKVTTDTK